MKKILRYINKPGKNCNKLLQDYKMELTKQELILKSIIKINLN